MKYTCLTNLYYFIMFYILYIEDLKKNRKNCLNLFISYYIMPKVKGL